MSRTARDPGRSTRRPSAASDEPRIARTFSAAEDFLVAFDQSGRGMIMGEPGGSGGLVCSKHDAYADGKEFVGVGVMPQITARPTVAGFRAGKDTVLERAMAEIEKNRLKK